MISLTVPPSSVETVAPCTAETEPTAESTGAQSSSFTGALVTVATGIGCFVVAIFTICNALIPKIIRNNTPTAERALITILQRAAAHLLALLRLHYGLGVDAGELIRHHVPQSSEPEV